MVSQGAKRRADEVRTQVALEAEVGSKAVEVDERCVADSVENRFEDGLAGFGGMRHGVLKIERER
jgi:hypothetical protein